MLYTQQQPKRRRTKDDDAAPSSSFAGFTIFHHRAAAPRFSAPMAAATTPPATTRAFVVAGDGVPPVRVACASSPWATSAALAAPLAWSAAAVDPRQGDVSAFRDALPLNSGVEPSTLGLFAAKHMLLHLSVGINRVNAVIDDLEKQYEEDEKNDTIKEDITYYEPNLNLFFNPLYYADAGNIWRGLGGVLARGVATDAVISTVNRLLDRAVIREAPYALAKKLVKNVNDSAKRKAARHVVSGGAAGGALDALAARGTAALRVTPTAFRGLLLPNMAAWIVFSAVDAYAAPDGAARTRALVARAKSAVAGYVLACLGAALGTLVWPGNGTYVGSALAPLGASLLIDLVEGLLGLGK